MLDRHSMRIPTAGRGTLEITGRLAELVASSDVREGLCHVFCHHTSASLLVSENADPDVRRDLETWLARAVPDGDPAFVHDAEGPDDMPAHVRSALLATELTLPVAGGRLDLGTWQGVFLYEHRHGPHQRRLSVTVAGDAS